MDNPTPDQGKNASDYEPLPGYGQVYERYDCGDDRNKNQEKAPVKLHDTKAGKLTKGASNFLTKLSPNERISASLTLLIAISTLVNVGVAICSFRLVKSSSETATRQTGQLISASVEIAMAADDFSNSATRIETHLGDAVADFRQAASQAVRISERAAKNAQESFLKDQRAWIGMADFHTVQFEESKPIQIDLNFFNSGKTPALKMHEIINYRASSIPLDGPLPEDIAKVQAEVLNNPINASPPQGKFTSRLKDTASEDITKRYLAIKNRILFLYLFGEIEYQDIGGTPHTTQFCIFLSDPETKELQYCKSFNELD